MSRRAVLLNDTYAWYHWGCTATSSAIHKRIREIGYSLDLVPINQVYGFDTLPEKIHEFDDPQFFQKASRQHPEIIAAIDAADVVVINGEGTMHHVRPASLSLLYLAYAAKVHLNKSVHMINHSAYPENVVKPRHSLAFQIYRGVYQKLDYVAIREHVSHKLMRQLGVQAELSFDCLPLTAHEDYQPSPRAGGKKLVIAGSVAFDHKRMPDLANYMEQMAAQGFEVAVLSGALANPSADDCHFIENLRAQRFQQWQHIEALTLSEWFDCIASADLFVSGRFHHTIASASLGTPCVIMESNTPKIRALTESLQLASPIHYGDDRFLETLLQRTAEVLRQGPVDDAIIGELRQRAELNFEGIRHAA